MVLDKVSFDHQLFTKEYRKATTMLQSNEIDDLNAWIRSKGLPPHVSNMQYAGPDISHQAIRTYEQMPAI
jgi:hypothetical protein